MQGYALIASSDGARTGLYREILLEEGYEPVVASDGDAARAILRSRGVPAMTIAELSLARADGFSLLGQVRHMRPSANPSAVVVSAFPEFRETAWRLREDLGISEVLSTVQVEAGLRAAVRRASCQPEDGGTASAEAPSAPLPMQQDEAVRLAIIASLGIVDDAPPDEALQRLVEQTAIAFGVPIALVSIILEDRQWFKAMYGLSGDILIDRGTPRSMAFCRHIAEGDTPEPLVVPDARLHPVFAGNPLVKQGVIRSYAGAPVVSSSGHVLGTLCIVDTKPLGIGPQQVDRLAALARQVAQRLESSRRAASKPAGPN